MKLIISVGFFLLLSIPVAFSQQPVFGPAVNLGPKINSAGRHESDPFLTADGKKLFFSDGADIWFSEMTDTGWTNAQRLGPQINYSIFYQRSPSVSPDGQKLYYVDAERGGYNWDIWVSTWDSSIDDWGTSQNLGAPVNTPGDEFSARIAPDGRHLYFTSRYLNLRDGMYVSEWNGSSWSTPAYLGDNVSGNGSESPSITADGRWFYFYENVDTVSVYVSPWTDSGWGSAISLKPQFNRNTIYPFITPSGDSLFFSALENGFPGYGSDDLFVAERISTGIKDTGATPPLPKTFELYQNYPNPFNGRTTIKFFVSRSLTGPTSVTVFNILGVPVRHLLQGQVITGTGEVEWDGNDDKGKGVSTGIYLIQLKVRKNSLIKKATLVK